MDLRQMDLAKLGRRYGPVAGVVLSIVLVVFLVPDTNAPSSRLAAGQPQSGAELIGQPGDETVAPGADATSPTGASGGGTAARRATTGRSGGGSPNIVQNSPVAACGKNGRLDIQYAYAPPCVAAFSGNNGGATWQGVEPAKVKVGVHLGWHTDPQTAAAARATGSCATNECQWDFIKTYVKYFEKRYQTYGRKVELFKITASGPTNDDAAARADAGTAKANKAFAVIGGPASTAFADELKEVGILCFCTTSLPQEFYESHAPFVWSTLHASTQAYLHRAEYIGKRLAGQGRKAIYAGDAVYKTQERKFGFIYYNTPRGDYTSGAKFFLEHIKARYGVDIPAERVTDYSGQTLGDAQVHAPRMVAQMQSQGVNSLIFAGDPIQPIALTSAAAKANWYPEWIVTGSALTDTDSLARLYDQTEWKNAFGISLLAVPLPQEKQFTYRAYRAEQDMAEPAPDPSWARTDPKWPTVDAGLYSPPMSTLYTGIHLAGPILTPNTFQAGMFSYPSTGGTVTVTRVSYGPKQVAGLKFTDYTAYDDTMEIWWDPTVPADKTFDGRVGAYQRVNGGKRYNFGEWPSTDPRPFEKGHGEVTKYDNPPDQ